MSFKFKKKLPVPKEIKELYPVSPALAEKKKLLDTEIIDVITGKSDKFLAIIGPCSADNEESVCEYIERLVKVQEKIKDKVIIIPRIYTNKPRTTGEGYKGMLHQPDPEKAPDLLQGIIAIRKLHMHALETYGMPIADEMLYPENYWYLADILSYVAIGARSVEDQQHRLVTSGFDVPAGMKNPTSGDFSVMLNSVVAAQGAHNFIYRGWDVNTEGNPYAHTILRGSTNKYGRSRPNYHYEDLIKLHDMYGERNLKFPATIVDANHANSDKQFKEQIRIVKEVLHSRSLSTDIQKLVKGVMIESYLVEGNQKIGCQPHVYGQSITDPCLGWEDSENLLYEIAERC
ncbi:3-deoxy-7-phosphoheptulonate synthase [Frisingicoccus sp.]|uniref:3-deoxy-7-phosphoheptulonate synthase n=1 Tax=Frisingicoccus sp. TaxID=1918627 RepID=UPI0015AFA692